MRNSKINLKEAIKFHGHLGPYLVLGILAGDLALKKLRSRKYFGLKVKVGGLNKKPQSCFLDGLQLSTGCTYGKGNIAKIKGRKIKILCYNLKNKRKLNLSLKKDLINKLDSLKTHKDSETFARRLYGMDLLKIFNLTPKR
jgi:formylmethanofuran dehydrogenase subunit E